MNEEHNKEDIIEEVQDEIYESESQNEDVEEGEYPEPSKEELQKTIDSLKIEVSDEDKEKYAPVEKKKPGRKKKDAPTTSELASMSDEEIENSIDGKDKDLYMEFAAFLEDKAKIKSDDGIKEVIPTGVDVLDAVMGGGFAVGTLGMTIGAPGCGKSMISIQTMASGQRKFKDKILVSFLDSEEATTIVRLSNLGVRFPKIKPYTDITVEKVFKFLEGLCLYKEMKHIVDQPSIVVWDSVANTLSEKEREVEDVNSAIGYKARLLSLLIPKYCAKLAQYNISLLTINQLRDNIQIGNMKPAKELKFMTTGKTIPGGNALKFNSFHLLEMRVKEVLKPDKYGFDGIKVSVWCVKNKLFPPNIPVEVVGNFVTGFSNFWTNYDFMVECGVLNTGAWNYLINDPKQRKFRTKDAIELYKSDPEFKEIYDSEAKSAIQVNIIDKYNSEI